ncbi:MAG TPA: PepSY domain-containing protein, partial [Pseudomonas sp.]|uniref:PepSY-associated TM helix domain-containing protein n=1 Tax=Pseudomonas sp. TaxID=306 RepID=UPI002CA4522C
PHAAHNGHAATEPASPSAQISLQQVVDTAAARGVQPGYSITWPKGAQGVFSIALFADDPRNDATLHLDQYSGAVLADVRWKDYGAVARTVETGVMLHEGKLFGLANQLLMLLVCLMILFGAVSGLVLWWMRRPPGRFGVPPLRHDLPRWKTAVVVMALLGIAFPLVGASLVLIGGLDWLFSRVVAPRRMASNA